MADWPAPNEDYGIACEVIGLAHPWALGTNWRAYGTNVAASTAWPAANRVVLWPFRLPRQVTVYQIAVGFGATSGGNFDVGIYDWFGNRLVNSGSTARSATTEVFVNTTDTTIGPGRYWAALQLDGTNTVYAFAPANVGITKAMGIRQASPGSFGLPSTVTFETSASAFVPMCVGLWLRSTT